MSSPLRGVLDAIGAGARSRTQIVEETGLRPDAVDAAIEHLVRMGRLEARSLATGCTSGGCSSCPSGDDHGGAGCGAGGPSGPVLVQLSVRP